MYSVGRIPGAYLRREGRPSERGVLVSRLIDRPMRPFFDDDLRNDVVVTCTSLSNDKDNSIEVVASLGAFIATAYSDVPWNGPMATTQVAYVDGEYVVNPSYDQHQRADMFVTIASTAEKVVMIETEANEIPEDILLGGIKLAHETNQKIVAFINEIVAEIGLDTDAIAAALLLELSQMRREFLSRKSDWIAAFSQNCLTVGKDIQILRAGTVRQAKATGIGPDAELLVEYPDGTSGSVSSGEVSVRGLYGYV